MSSDKPILLRGEKTYAVIESMISGMIFFSPNFLLFFSVFRDYLWIFFIYNYGVMFLLVSAIANLKFQTNEK